MFNFTRSVVGMTFAFVAFFMVMQPNRPPAAAVPVAPPVAASESGSTSDSGSTTAAMAQSEGGQQVVLTRSSDGHFYTDAQVNGHTIHFLVDTGATTVALSHADAEAAGIDMDPSKFTGTGRGASGAIAFMPVTLERVGIGNLEESDVDGVVLDGPADMSLLGQSWLKRINSVTIVNDRMTLE